MPDVEEAILAVFRVRARLERMNPTPDVRAEVEALGWALDRLRAEYPREHRAALRRSMARDDVRRPPRQR